MNKLPNLIILGPQGCGKGTQSQILVQKFEYQAMSSGDLIRERIAQNDDFGKRLSEKINTGKLADDQDLIKLIEDKLSQLDLSKPLIFDGFPRNKEQKVFIDDLIYKLNLSNFKVLYINIDEQESLKRIATRKICPKCNAIYFPEKDGFKEGKCTKCNSQLIVRADDTDDAVKERLKIFKEKTLPIIELYKKERKLIEINGMQSIEKVAKDIAEGIKNHG